MDVVTPSPKDYVDYHLMQSLDKCFNCDELIVWCRISGFLQRNYMSFPCPFPKCHTDIAYWPKSTRKLIRMLEHIEKSHQMPRMAYMRLLQEIHASGIATPPESTRAGSISCVEISETETEAEDERVIASGLPAPADHSILLAAANSELRRLERQVRRYRRQGAIIANQSIDEDLERTMRRLENVRIAESLSDITGRDFHVSSDGRNITDGRVDSSPPERALIAHELSLAVSAIHGYPVVYSTRRERDSDSD